LVLITTNFFLSLLFADKALGNRALNNPPLFLSFSSFSFDAAKALWFL